MPGPRPTPTEILKLRGSRRADRPGEPQPPKGRPEMPDWLSEPARGFWGPLAEVLMEVPGLLRLPDAMVMGRCCEALVDWLRCVRFVRQYGDGKLITRVGEDGKEEVVGTMYFAEATQRLRYEKVLSDLEAKLGLSPADRARIQITAAEEPEAVVKRDRRA